MLELDQLCTEVRSGPVLARLTLPYLLRQRSRLRARLDDGREVAVCLARGQCLRPGSRLSGPDGLVVEVVPAAEPVSCARALTPQQLARACYHLGNRHVPLQIGEDWLCYGHDHVLDAMLRGLGMAVTGETLPFDPEPGAYGGGHAHGAHAEHAAHHPAAALGGAAGEDR